MEVGNREHDQFVKVSLELESLLQRHFQHREHSKRVLKDHLREAKLEIAQLRQSVSAYSEQLKEERFRSEALQREMEDLKRRQVAEITKHDELIRERMCDIDTQARLTVVKTEECERRLQCLQQQETELLNRENDLKYHQASFEAGIILAQRQTEAERLCMQHARENAEQVLEEARISALATEERRHKREMLYNLEMQCFGLEKEEATRRIHIIRQEILEIMGLISSRQTHVSVAEAKAVERIRLLEQEFVSRKEIFELREKEIHLRQQREQQHLKDERERVASMKEAMQKDYRLLLEGIHLFGNGCSTEPERLQVDALRDLQKLFVSMLDDHHLERDRKL
ncbi:hypothetical protein TraAM80_06992 [Trypanosoma rangeli]|uniref:Uncharacterized protein n=1 Tax=Trypanosoma rangeli TaxID=5698 RepID=A0A422N7M1_TRYRA|nr:uncharacterized protein TraAM80_06992 [Trypanosoma rangeli]RNF01451.1 hypothetical protein TraAM80_06992 [Trypanosoma rangeli]|eukprot:RNF01451.1 hypothetical protein TraAM80_06992 [Trypanosoma rangeli]